MTLPTLAGMLDLMPLAILGAVLGLDVVSFPQAMISRPLVAATMAGVLLGYPAQGLLIGATLEFFALETLPFGASRYPEWGSAAVVGGALFSTQPEAIAGALTTATLAALATAWVGGWSMVQLRTLNARWARKRHDAIAKGAPRVVIGLQLFGLTGDLLRGFLLTGIALYFAIPAQRVALAAWTVDARLSRAAVVGIAATVAAAAVWKIFHATPGARWLFAAGILAGLGILAIR